MIEWTGWSLPAVLAALGGFGAAVVALHFLRMRRRVVQVPWLQLWDRVLADERRTRLFDLLKRWWSLLLALAVVALLAFALGDPRAAGARSEGRHLVVLVDASASMQATDVGPDGRFEAAREATRRLVRDLGPRDRMLVAELADAALPRSPLTDDQRLLEAAVDALSPRATRADLGAGLRFARDVLRGASRPEVVVVSDGALSPERVRVPDGTSPRLSWIPLGDEEAPNVAISAFAVRRYPLDKTQAEVLVEVWNTTGEDRRVELQLVGDAGVLDVVPLEVPAGERLRRFFENVSGADRRLEARVRPVGDAVDALPLDDAAYAMLPPRRRARILVVTEGNLYLEAALLLDEYLDVTTVAPGAYAGTVGDGAGFDAVIFDRVLPPARPPVSAFYLGPRGEGFCPVELGDAVERPFFDRLDDDHPLLRFTSLRDVNVALATRVDPGPDDEVAAADAGGAPLLVTGRRGPHRFVVLPFDLADSDLPLRVAWPLLLLHAIDWFADEAVDFVSSHETGRTWRIPVPADADVAEITDPSGGRHRVGVEGGRAVFLGQQVGFHEVSAGGETTLVAANLGPGTESLLRRPERLEVAGRVAGEPSAGSPGARREPWWFLVVLALTLVIAEWFLHHRRWTE